jgi:hypothetical protein
LLFEVHLISSLSKNLGLKVVLPATPFTISDFVGTSALVARQAQSITPHGAIRSECAATALEARRVIALTHDWLNAGSASSIQFC